MKIKMITTYAGPLGTFQPGSDPPVPEVEKIGLVDAGFAVLVDVSPKRIEVETEMKPEPENAAIITGKPGKRSRK